MLMNTQWDFCEREDAILIKPKNGRLDFSNSLDLEKHLNVFIKEQMVSRVVLDLQNVAYVDSCALGILVEAHRMICRKGGLCICHIHPHILNLLKLTRLDEVFRLYDDCEDALGQAA